jgi:hypothetical protein
VDHPHALARIIICALGSDIDHQPWPLQKAEARVLTNSLDDWLGIDLNHEPAALHFAKSLDVHAWLVERI